MPEAPYVAAAIAVAAVVTLALRAAPFATARLRDSSTVRRLGRHLPSGVMVILVVYLLRDTPVHPAVAALPTIAGVAVTVAVHLWRRQALASIVVGSLAYGAVFAACGA
jgi:branched-subunit amino acid transport protein AzlD